MLPINFIIFLKFRGCINLNTELNNYNNLNFLLLKLNQFTHSIIKLIGSKLVGL